VELLVEKQWSIGEFCLLAGISTRMFYKMLREKTAPETVVVGRRRFIPDGAARAWQEAHRVPNAA
jgi:predicted DNA-binding transcriptional regulator AlpA